MDHMYEQINNILHTQAVEYTHCNRTGEVGWLVDENCIRALEKRGSRILRQVCLCACMLRAMLILLFSFGTIPLLHIICATCRTI